MYFIFLPIGTSYFYGLNFALDHIFTHFWGSALRDSNLCPYSLTGWPLNLPNFLGLDADCPHGFPAVHGIYFDPLLGKEAENQDLGSPPAAPPYSTSLSEAERKSV